VAELLDIVQQEVADYALSQVMNGGSAFGPFDAATRFYIMYRWSYGKNKIEFDDGMRMAMALGAEVDALMHSSSVLKKSGSSVALLGPYEREQNIHLGEPGRDGLPAMLIDMVHRSALLWRAGRRDELARYVATHIGTRVEPMRAVAQALVNVLPDGDKEKQLYEGFLQGELPSPPSAQQMMFIDHDFGEES
jgi:putative DNA methylase